MSFPNVQRNEGAIVVYLTPDQATPPCPPELRAHISEGDWSYRLSAVGRVVKRSSAQLFERIWFGLALAATFVAPIIIYQFVLKEFENKWTLNLDGKLAELHAIGFGVFLGIAFLFWTPLAIWKGIASIRVRKLMNGFEREDTAKKPNAAERPKWTVHLPGVFGARAWISITLPPAGPLSSFDLRAELPPYIASYAPPPTAYPNSLDMKTDLAMQPIGYADIKNPAMFEDEKTARPTDFVHVDFNDSKV